MVLQQHNPLLEVQAKLLSNPDGKYEWRFETFRGYTVHRDGRIIHAEASGTQNKYHGLSAILRIVSNPQIECDKLEDASDEANITEDWEYVCDKIKEQVRMTSRYFHLKPHKDDVVVKVLDIPKEQMSDVDKDVLLEMPSRVAHFEYLTGENKDLLLWRLVMMEEKGVLQLIEPHRVVIPKKAG